MKAILITVRTGSTRLPNKALLSINGKTTIEHLIDRVKGSELADEIILCTTTLPEDDVLCRIAIKNGIKYYKGSVEDKLERWNGACREYGVEFFVTADGDVLFCEPQIIDMAFEKSSDKSIDFIKCDEIVCGAFTYGIRYEALKKACKMKDTAETEMMWVYFTDTGEFNIHNLDVPKIFKRSDIRMTLDYEEDLMFFKNVFSHFGLLDFNLVDIIDYINKKPEVAKINIEMEKAWSENQKNKTTLKVK